MATKKRRPVRTIISLLVVALVGAGILTFGVLTHRTTATPKMALDLEGGTQLILTPSATDGSKRQINDQDINQAISIIRNRVDSSGVAESEITSMGSSNIVVSLPGRPSQETLDLIRASSKMEFRPALDESKDLMQKNMMLAQYAQGLQSGQSGQSDAMDEDPAIQPQSGNPIDANQKTWNMSNSIATAKDGIVTPGQPADPKLNVFLKKAFEISDSNGDGVLSTEPAKPPTSNSDNAWITEKLTFDYLTKACANPASHAGHAAPGDQPVVACDMSSGQKLALGPADVKGENLAKADSSIRTNSNGQPTGGFVVNLEFDSVGAKAFAETSKRLVDFDSNKQGKNQFAIVLDGSVISAPRMDGVINNGSARIDGNFTASSAKTLANQLKFGSLPLDFKVESQQLVSASLGSEHLEKGIWAGVIGLILVVLYMIWQYRGLALLSAGSLFVAAGLTYLVISLLSWGIGYRLSLPGVVGLIVAVGITADSFIVYFERIRDEVRDGHPLINAVDEGWDRAKRTILISDGVNLVAAVVLYLLAVGGVQGFAFTLGVTTVIDLFVIFFFTHPIMELLIRVPFFGTGHKLSGLDPEHLGATSRSVYAGRGRITRVTRKTKDTVSADDGESSSKPKTMAQRRQEMKAHASALSASDAEQGNTDSMSTQSSSDKGDR